MRRLLYALGVAIMLMLLIFLLGPRPDFEDVNPNPASIDLTIDQIESYIQEKDGLVTDLKPGNEAFVQWADPSSKSKTEYVVLYLHGFSASAEEGSDVHRPLAQAVGANLYVPRLEDSGRQSIDSYKELTPKKMLDSAKEALAVAKLLGDKIILVSCSTGGTYSAYLAGYDKDIAGLVMLSPNIDLYDTRTNLILKPWGAEFLDFMQEGEYNVLDHYTDAQKLYWNKQYHNDGIVALKYLIDMTMKKEHFSKITQPTFIMTYYKNEEEQDKVVSVKRMREFYGQITTPSDKKRFIDCPECTSHVIGSKLFNPNTDVVFKEVLSFAQNIVLPKEKLPVLTK
jgi:esterase/lipase